MNRLKKKLSSRAGESIGETLVALLISALALVMLAGAISSGMRIIQRSKDRMDTYYKVNNALVNRAATATTSDGTAVTGFTGTLTVSPPPSLLPVGEALPEVTYWKNDQLSGVEVVAYSKKDA